MSETDEVRAAGGIPGWAYKVLAKTDVSLKQAAWAYGCAKKGTEEERLLLELLWQVVERERAKGMAVAENASTPAADHGGHGESHQHRVCNPEHADVVARPPVSSSLVGTLYEPCSRCGRTRAEHRDRIDGMAMECPPPKETPK